MPDLVRLRHSNGVVVPRFDALAAREHAARLLIKAGFRLHYVSQRSITTYYTHPSREPLLLRLSDHSSKRSPMGLPTPIARVTLSERDQYLTERHVENLVAMAIGRYFLNDAKPSDYDGPRRGFTKQRVLMGGG